MADNKLNVHLPKMFSDGMVLQRRKPLPVWGFQGRTGDELELAIDNKLVRTTVDQNGNFYAELPPMEAGKGKTLTVSNLTAKTSVSFSDVSVGEVWYMAGQSNMAFKIHMLYDEDKEKLIATADNYDIRVFKIVCEPSPTEQKDVTEGSGWRKLGSANVMYFSAIAYTAAKMLTESMKDIPIAFVESFYGGSSAQAWMAHRKVFAEERENIYNNDAWRPLNDSHSGGCCGRTMWEDYAYYMQDENYLQKTGETENAPFTPCVYYNAMQKPLAPYAIAGVVWYQGESRVNSMLPEQYSYVLRDLIEQWREDFHDAELPVILIQLAPYVAGREWHFHETRQIQLETHKNIANVGLVTIAYEGPVSKEAEIQGEIHPRNKLPVGKRLGRTILGMVYGFAGEYMGPEIDKIFAEGNRAYLSFHHIADGLVIKEGEKELTGFTVSYDGEHFVQASAEIEGDRVAVYTDRQEPPIEVRYCHVNICPTDSRTLGGNLENSEGIPAFPFKMRIG